MRISILPLVIILLCCSVYGLSQGTCATANTLSLAANTCASFTTSTTNGNAQGGTGCGPNTRRITWFQFTAGATCPMFNFSNSANVASEISLWSGTCAALTEQTGSRLCMANGSGVWSPSATLTTGNIYYLRVYTNTTTSTTITICSYDISTATTVTLNTPCSNVPVLSVNPASSAGNSYACGYSDNDPDRSVTWIKFHPSSATACVNFAISTNSITQVNTEVSLFTGTCAGAIQAAQNMCLADGTGIWSPGPNFTWPNYTGTAFYYLRVYTSGTYTLPPGGQKQITFCGTETAPLNDACSGATQIDGSVRTDNNACDHGGNGELIYSGSTSNGNSSTPNAGWVCAGILHNTAWYKFKIGDPSVPTTIHLQNINCDLYSGTSGESGQPGGSIQVGLMTGSCMNPGILKAKSIANPTGNQGGAPNCYQGPGNGALHTADLTIPANSYPNGTWIYMGIDGYNGSNCKYGLSLENAIPIPVKLTKFMVFNAVNSNLVMWTTSSEMNSAYFEIERSNDGITFSPIGRVEASGNSTWDIHYKFEDTNPLLLGYYRLRQVDIDGKSDYSNVAKIQRDNTDASLKVAFANPVRNNATLNIMSGKTATVTIQIVDVAGRNLFTQVVDCVAGYNTITKDFSRLIAGNYYMVVTQGDSRIVKPFIKQ